MANCRLACAVVSILGAIVALVTALLSLVLLSDQLIDPVILEQLTLKNGSMRLSSWLNSPLRTLTKIYFFNVTNSDQFHKDAKHKPDFEEIGPYVYSESVEKTNVSWHPNGTISYTPKSTFHFEPHLSNGTESDVVRALNMVLLGVTESLAALSWVKYHLTMLPLRMLEFGVDDDAVISLSVKDLLWGHRNSLYDQVSGSQQLFGLLVGKNESAGEFNMFTGEQDLSRLGVISRWNGKKRHDYWHTDECNEILGTDGSMFPPPLTPNSKLMIFSPEMCRPLHLTYQKDLVRNSVPVYRFALPDDYFNTSAPLNQCYCDTPPHTEKNDPESESCGVDGIFMVSKCKYGIPIAFSKPHFLDADPRLSNLTGLLANPVDHDTYFDIVPKLGVPMAVKVRIQVNLVITNKNRMRDLQDVPTMVYPYFWFEIGVEELPQDWINKIKVAVNLPSIVRWSLAWSMLVLSMMLTIVTIILLRYRSA